MATSQLPLEIGHGIRLATGAMFLTVDVVQVGRRVRGLNLDSLFRRHLALFPLGRRGFDLVPEGHVRPSTAPKFEDADILKVRASDVQCV